MRAEDSLNPISRQIPQGEDAATKRMNVTQNLTASDVAGGTMPLVGKWAEIAKEAKTTSSSHTFQPNAKGKPFSHAATTASKVCSSIFRRSAEMLGVNSRITSPEHQAEPKKRKH
jgi:hypothetical protein